MSKCTFEGNKYYEQPCSGPMMRGSWPGIKGSKTYLACEKHAKENKKLSPFNGVKYVKLREDSKKALESIDGLDIKI